METERAAVHSQCKGLEKTFVISGLISKFAARIINFTHKAFPNIRCKVGVVTNMIKQSKI